MPAAANAATTTTAAPVCTRLASDGAYRRGCRLPSARGSSRSRPNANMYRDAALCNASAEASIEVHSRMAITPLTASPAYSVASVNSRLPSSRRATSLVLAAPIPPTTNQVVRR